MLGNFLKQRRLAMGFTQEFVAHQLKLSRQAISNWENGSREINLRDLLAYAKLLEISFEDLENHLDQTETPLKESPTKPQSRQIPKHFCFHLERQSSHSLSASQPTHIKIEGDRVIAIHLLLSHLFLDKHDLTLKNCPQAFDFLNILYELGYHGWSETSTHGDTIHIRSNNIPQDIVSLNQISRASIGIISGLTYRYQKLLFSFPGGDNFGHRPIDLHLDMLSTVASYRYDSNSQIFYAQKKDRLNQNISLNCYGDGSKSVGAFFNAINLAYVYPNEIRINGLSPNPTVNYLIRLLEQASNRQVCYLSPDKIIIPKVDFIEVTETEIQVPPDMTMLVAYVLLFWNQLDHILFDNLTIKDIPASYHHFFKKLGLSLYENKHSLQFQKTAPIDSNYFEFLPLGAAPFISTDLGPILSEFFALENIPSILFDEVFSHRTSHIPELKKLGILIKDLENGALKSQGRRTNYSRPGQVFDLKDMYAGMAILMGITQSKLQSATLLNFDQVFRAFGNIQDALKILGYQGHIQ
ncbi:MULTISPECIES: helix-turn-helix domain-containing protein [Aerococcus]|uniref:helix-turn-helix domain-containing protein n=1 Tax=Aerococcus TaxID=1375 RepID=UPI0018A76562|nr:MULTISPECIES: helix-turn-helix domain-containing protein [Aerococcus]MCY3035599.1 helix-turn-helix domain-containing protein [Aerococcus sp. Group 2]MCY3039273.1 helix-turn-helix domain-containing protein [Aerococcus sp. Group 2]MCY3041175.1 helix-turn-helix domain-containing protein [Aerococcus sp. Group 2]MCY3042412.1 helix-turn-helix domain-containing protein [Aerococcus sp. Group 2]MDK6520968.1 helix-turn-helix domain-containing protein [Aerococcus urinae]